MFLFQAAALTSDQGSTIQSLFVSFASSPFVQRVYLDLKIITIIYTAILFIAIVLVVINARPKKVIKEVEESLEGILAEPKSAEEYGGKWREILNLLEKNEESGWRHAVIEADKFFDDIMRRLGYSGNNFGERLKQVHATEVTNLDAIWDAHRIRNSISHDIEFKLSQDEARRAVGAYEQAMRDFEVI
jgi:RNAse (barnase) inhibitor barstar